jgi:hypothetical protein
MNTFLHLWQYLAEFFLEWEIFQTKLVEVIKTHILCSTTFLRETCSLWENAEKYGREKRPQMTSQYGAYALYAG